VVCSRTTIWSVSLDDDDLLSLPDLADANSAPAVTGIAGGGDAQQARARIAAPQPRIAGSNFG
jgi:hypothetical protein